MVSVVLPGPAARVRLQPCEGRGRKISRIFAGTSIGLRAACDLIPFFTYFHLKEKGDESGRGIAQRAGFDQPAVSTAGTDVIKLPNPAGVADWRRIGRPSGAWIDLWFRSPGVETPGWTKPALWAVPRPRCPALP